MKEIMMAREGEVDGARVYGLHLGPYRRRAGLTLQQVGERLGLHLTAVQKWEKGVTSPTADDLMRVAALYGVSPGALFLNPDEVAETLSANTLKGFAALAGVHPMALALAGDDPRRRKHVKQLTRCMAVLDRVSPEWSEQWIKLAELSSRRGRSSIH